MKYGGGYLAFKDLDMEPGTNWEKPDKYEPFYLVWKNVPYDDHSAAWPYGLNSISVVEGDPLYPTGNSDMAKGYELFQKNCQQCHSLNQMGGTMGPEFNHPKNITEYWDRETLIAFAKDPQSFRMGSKMVPVKHLEDDEFHAILDYLEYLAQQKHP